MRRFPTADALAAASEAEVLAAWSGLGYNRRALALRRAAAQVAADGWPRASRRCSGCRGSAPTPLGRSPASPSGSRWAWWTPTCAAGWSVASASARTPPGGAAGTRRWPRLGRRCGRRRSLDARHDGIRGEHLHPAQPRCAACPISAGCPSRGLASHGPGPRQAAFAGSDRAHRGAVLRLLSASPGHAVTVRGASAVVPAEAVDRIVAGLERDGLVHRSGGRLVLGGRREPVATIGA